MKIEDLFGLACFGLDLNEKKLRHINLLIWFI
jgi:hypothetical protein